MSFGAPPAAGFVVDVSDADVDFFARNGYLACERVTTPAELDWLRRVYDDLIARPRSGFLDGVFDLARPYGTRADPTLGQLLLPERLVPEIRETDMWRNAWRIAARLLGRERGELESWGHLIFKAAGTGGETPWHQDEAYWDVNLDYRALGAWLPLEDVGVDNGCLSFVPGSHRGEVLRHRHLGGDPAVHVLEVDEPVDTGTAIPVPLRAGGMTFHHARTLHYAGPNRTDRIRRAWANEFQTRPVRRAQPADRPWVEAGRRAMAERLAEVRGR
jgi:hypothetical protein